VMNWTSWVQLGIDANDQYRNSPASFKIEHSAR
jgi:hypothetical protein